MGLCGLEALAVAALWQTGGAEEGGESWVAERQWHPLISVTVTSVTVTQTSIITFPDHSEDPAPADPRCRPDRSLANKPVEWQRMNSSVCTGRDIQ